MIVNFLLKFIDKAFQHLEIELRKILYVVSGVGGIEAIISADVRYIMQIKCPPISMSTIVDIQALWQSGLQKKLSSTKNRPK